jgi:hypothetical protein
VNAHWKRDLVVAALLMLGWLGLIALATRRVPDACNNQCATDQHCKDMCKARNDCPNWDKP